MSNGKTCIYCGQDCSAKPRVKDPQGRYACKSCAEAAAHANASHAEPVAAPANDEFDIFAGLGEPATANIVEGASALQSGCANCGVAMTPGTVVCTRCGYNTKTGKVAAPTIKQEKKKSSAGAAATSAAAAAGANLAAPVFWILGGCVGGGIGAAIWAGIAYATGWEFGWIAWGVGFLTGLGVAVGAGGNGNALSGVIAVVIAVLSICAGKYFTVTLALERAFGGDFALEEIWDEDVLVYLADREAKARLERGETIDWPVAGTTWEEAEWPDDYPADLQDHATDTFAAMSPAQVEQCKYDVIEDWKSTFRASKEEWAKEGFFYMWGVFDIIFVLLAVATAYKVGATEMSS